MADIQLCAQQLMQHYGHYPGKPEDYSGWCGMRVEVAFLTSCRWRMLIQQDPGEERPLRPPVPSRTEPQRKLGGRSQRFLEKSLSLYELWVAMYRLDISA